MNKPKFSFIIFAGLFLLGGVPGAIYLLFYLLKRILWQIRITQNRRYGYIEIYGLQNWWKSLTKNEKSDLLSAFDPKSPKKNALIDGEVEIYEDRDLWLSELAISVKTSSLKYSIATDLLLKMRRTSRKTTDEYFICDNIIQIFKSLKRENFRDSENNFFESCALQIKIGKYVRPYLGKPLTIMCRGYDELIVYFRSIKDEKRVKELQDDALEDGWRIKEYKKGIGVR